MSDTCVSTAQDEMGRLQPYLNRPSTGIYKYRRRLPDNLKGLTVWEINFPRTEWILSLGTGDPHEARRMRDPLAAKRDSIAL